MSISPWTSATNRIKQDMMLPNFPNNRYNTTVDTYQKTIKEVKKHVEKREGIFLHFIQPNIYFKKNLSKFEKEIVLKAESLNYPNLDKAFKKTIPLIKDVFLNQNYSTNLTNSLDTVHSTVYFDHCHINELGNKVISDNIFKKIESMIKK